MKENKLSPIADRELDEILTRYYGDDTLAGENSVNLKAKSALLAWKQRAVRFELEKIMQTSSGGGSWRKNIIARLAQLQKGKSDKHE